MPLSGDKNTLERLDGALYEDPVAANATIHGGALVVLNAAGWAVPASTATGLKVRGVAQDRVVGGATNGAVTIRTKRGVYCFKNSAAADAIARADIGTACFIVDDETVAKTNGTNTRSQAGIVRDVDSRGVWVEV